MKSLYIIFEDEDWERLKACKGNLGWRDAILSWAKVKP